MLPAAELFPFLLPLLVLTIGTMIALVAEPFMGREAKHKFLPPVAVVTALAAMGSYALTREGSWHGILAMDSHRALMGLVVLASSILGLVGLQQKLGEEDFPGGEPYVLMLLATAGVLLMTMATSTLSLFLGMEMASLPIYALVGLRRNDEMGAEALFKYFIMGAVFSAVFLYGAALCYGATGTTQFGGFPLPGRDVFFYVGAFLMSVGLLFKAGVAPFHFWSADAYAGAPSPVTGFMAAVVKIGSLVALGSLWQAWLVLPTELPQRMFQVFVILGVMSVVIGAFSGLGQRRARRLMAFSSVSHAGFLVFALIPTGMSSTGGAELSNLWFYLTTYALGTASVLTCLSALTGKNDEGDTLQALAGAGKANPLLGAVATVGLASMAGFPPAAGFLAKFNVLASLVGNGEWKLAAILLLLALVGAVYYIRLAVVLWAEPETARAPVAVRPLLSWAVAIAGILTILALFFPARFGA
jgi:NADH-quinone oxidoreductase subunit N